MYIANLLGSEPFVFSSAYLLPKEFIYKKLAWIIVDVTLQKEHSKI